MIYVANFRCSKLSSTQIVSLSEFIEPYFCFKFLEHVAPFSLINNSEFIKNFISIILLSKILNICVVFVIKHVKVLKIVLNVICVVSGLILNVQLKQSTNLKVL